MAQPPKQFMNPDDFAPVKGRGGRWYCKLCTPPEHTRGQAMTLSAALRHEQSNGKHRDKVDEAIRKDWFYDPPCDWSPTPLPEGTTAWEQGYPYDGVNDFVEYWLEGIAAAERGEKLETMDAFIDRYNEKYKNLVDDWNKPTAEWTQGQAQGAGEEAKAEEEEEGWNGVPGYWYSGGSFLPHEDGMYDFSPSTLPQGHKEQAQGPWHDVWVIKEDPREECLRWGLSPEEVYAWDATPGDAAQPASDATPRDAPVASRAPQKTDQRRHGNGRQGKNRGRGKNSGGVQKQNGTTEGASRRPDVRRHQAKVY